MLNKLPSVIKDQLHTNFKNINQQNGGSILVYNSNVSS